MAELSPSDAESKSPEPETQDITQPGTEETSVSGYFFPRGTVPQFTPTTFLLGERVTQGLFGVKAGARWGKFGLFGKLRPGLINFNEGSCQGVLFNGYCFGGLMPGALCRDANGNVGACPQSLRGGTKFAFDLGEVIEFYPTRRFVLRVDLGDTVIRNSQPDRTSHNFQIGVGIGVRF